MHGWWVKVKVGSAVGPGHPPVDSRIPPGLGHTAVAVRAVAGENPGYGEFLGHTTCCIGTLHIQSVPLWPNATLGW